MQKVVVGIISRTKQNNEVEYLLVSSKKDVGEFTGFYYPPGGQIEVGEDEQTALIRELKEELDLDIKPTARITATAGDVADSVVYWWECEIVGDDTIEIKDSNIANAGYFTRNDMDDMKIWPATRKFFDEFIWR